MQRLQKKRQALLAERGKEPLSKWGIIELKSNASWIRDQYVLDRGCLFDDLNKEQMDDIIPYLEQVMRYWGIKWKWTDVGFAYELNFI